MKRLLLCATALMGLATISSCRRPFPPAPDRDSIAGTVTAFHDALARGDRDAAMSLLARDAQIVETGHRQTREEYEVEHLGTDIDFAKSVPSTRGALIVRQEGAVAWTTSTGSSIGTFEGSPVDAENAELMVLTKQDDRWQIRAIHWSSHSHR
ncbi:hypothetical protein BH18VER1_BH18VER1_10450 [soil metagenome]